MRFFSWLVTIALLVNLPITAAVDARDSLPGANTTTGGANPSLLADCGDSSFQPTALTPRQVIRRSTYSSKFDQPGAKKRHAKHGKPGPHKHSSAPKGSAHKPSVKPPASKAGDHKAGASKPFKRKTVSKKPHHRKAGSGRPHKKRPTADTKKLKLHRVTYASPLCGQRTQMMNAMLGLPDALSGIDESPPGAALGTDPALAELATLIGTPNTITSPTTTFPTLPGPGLLVVVPPNPGGVPEPESWAMMLTGFGLVGWGIRRRRAFGTRPSAAE